MAYKTEDSGTHASSQAKFRTLPPKQELLKVAAKVLGVSQAQLNDYPHGGYRSDQADILLRLIEDAGNWVDKLTLTKTQAGGLQLAANTRLFELRKELKAHGLTVACLIDGSGERNKSFYRLAWQDEVKQTPSGRVAAYTVGERKKPAPAKPVQAAPKRTGWRAQTFVFGRRAEQAPLQQRLLDVAATTISGGRSNLDFETGKVLF